jgi:TolB-like protein/Tfp pilus assembly protein PilF
MTSLKLEMLGGFNVAGAPGPQLPAGKAEALLAYLAVPTGRMHRREKLASLLWGDSTDAKARHSLAQTLYVLRNTLGPNGNCALVVDGPNISLDASRIDVDVKRFAILAAQRAADALTEAVRLYQGDFLEGVDVREEAFEDWLRDQRERLRKIAIDSLNWLLSHQMETNDDAVGTETARRLLALDPLQEPVHRTLMRLLFKSGGREAALRQYKSCAKVLSRELNIEPDAETKALYSKIAKDRSVLDIRLAPDGENNANELAVHPLPDKPSIAVLPFANITGDPTQEYFADGMAEDIITALSKYRWLFVIARNSSFTYKGRAVAVQQIAREMGVRYVLEGSVRKGGDRVRVSAQLIDATNDRHLWANHFDGQLGGIFDLQDKITESIVGAIAPEIGQAEIARAKRRPPESLDAWSLYQHGLALLPSGVEEDIQAAIKFFDQAKQADPGFVDALAMAAFVRTRLAYFFQPINYHELLDDAEQLLRSAVRLDPRNFACHMALGRLYYTLGEYDLAVAMAREAVTLNPNSATAHESLGIALFGANRYEESLQHKDIALRLSPNDPRISSTLAARASALFMLGRYEECAESALRSSRGPHPRYWADSYAVAALTKLGRKEEANLAKKRLLERKADYSVSNIQKFYASAHPRKLVKLYCDALREAGLPD